MTVHFIGAGPGAADLITVRGQNAIAAAPVCLYAGALVPEELLEKCPQDARLVNTAKMTLDEIIDELVTADQQGLDVARLHSGDPSVLSAMAEQMRRLDAAGVDYDVVPGVPAFAAAAASLKREFTVPGVSQTVVLTRTAARATAMPEGQDLATLGLSRSTLVLHLAIQRVDQMVEELVPNYGQDCPVAVVARASRSDEVILRGTLKDIAEQVHAAEIKRTAVLVVGEALAASQFQDSSLYSASRQRD
ncbi:precorrin-4 C(11)-methyltransferase [Saccharopolyspora dendranthemae]|uniref:Precorrin-4/cobalt-precorrin-4 C11-methyltransferase n=1 Tax=Saccharopolyspora dendranthemae TaxID=1181886 RepID=A0A561V810_9PSEU|nr:precorrin-4 C(11)-methyltransferase [Saccharopolyspora dendranthemae]TWG07747.1 precorrin-4/cobalt-precorrin-4 C11-methyltransferase [Saccharopolyspora dendranthemae]